MLDAVIDSQPSPTEVKAIEGTLLDADDTVATREADDDAPHLGCEADPSALPGGLPPVGAALDRSRARDACPRAAGGPPRAREPGRGGAKG